ncbi:MAG: sulfatase [Bacteroidetes bacterium]|nr:MAG: sulfatase [Bacteroidota bacterium]
MTNTVPFRFLKLYAFWMLFFVAGRLVFLLYNLPDTGDSGFGEILAAFFHALYVDTATACYFLVIPFFLFSLMCFWPSPWPDKINRWYNLLIIICVSMLTMSELPIYDEWGHKLTYKALWFLQDPGEVFHTASWMQLIFGILGITLFSWGGWWLFRKLMGKPFQVQQRQWIMGSGFFLLTPVLLFTGLRGGWMPIPVQVSDAYYSTNNFLNNVSVNSSFHLFSSLAQRRQDENYKFIPQEEARKIFAEMHRVEKDTTVSIFSNPKPNIMLVVLEGWSADLVKGMGGFDGITPRFDELIRQGVVFDSCYSSGNLSDQGMAAVFSAFPAQPHTSIITQPDKYTHLPCIGKEFEKSGYGTSYQFGGQLSYGNIRAYMYYNGFDKILEGKDFDASVPQGRLGAHDEYVYKRQISELKNAKEPFFAGLFTLSTHGPFDIPMKKDKLKWGDDEQDYINSAYYADSCIGKFIEAAKKEPWYKNTVFVFVSDHSHNSPKKYIYYNPEYRRIVMMLYGEPIRAEFRGYHHRKICSQVDLASTLLHQLGMDASKYRYSKNLFNPYTPELAFYSHEYGIGFISPKGSVVYNIGENKWLTERARKPEDLPELKKQSQAYLQAMFEEYLKF